MNKQDSDRVSDLESKVTKVEQVDTRLTRALTNEMDAMLSEAAAESLKEKQDTLDKTIKAVIVASGVEDLFRERFDKLIRIAFDNGEDYGNSERGRDHAFSRAGYKPPTLDDLFK